MLGFGRNVVFTLMVTMGLAARLDSEGKCEEAEAICRLQLAKVAPSPALLNNAGNHYLMCGQP